MQFEDAAQDVKARWREIMPMLTSPAKQRVNGETSWICPICGHGSHGDGLTKNPDSKSGAGLKCFGAGCGFGSGTIIDLYAVREGLDPKADYRRIVTDLAGMLGVSIDETGHKPAPAAQGDKQSTKDTTPEYGENNASQRVPNTPGKYKDLIEEAESHSDQIEDYLRERAISKESIRRFHLGYKPDQYFVKAGKELPGLIYPYSASYSYYGARSLEDKYFSKPNTNEAGSEPLYYPAALYTGDPCFVVEGALDAISIMQYGGNAVAVIGSSGNQNLLDQVDQRRPSARLILNLDVDPMNDKGHRPGQEAQEKLAAELDKRNIPYMYASYHLDRYKKHSDPNDMLVSDKFLFASDVAENMDRARAMDDPTGLALFLVDSRSERYRPISTGLSSVDKLLDGGLLAQTLVFLGAEPGAGKTTLAPMIFEAMAEAGRPGVYFNFEMPREHLLARSLSRRIYLKTKKTDLTVTKILRGYERDDEEKKLIDDAAEEYRRKIGTKLMYMPDVSPDVDALLERLEAIGQDARARGVKAPNVCIDYLQLLTGEGNMDQREIIKKAVDGLKQYAIRYNAVVFAITAQNREANKSRKAILEAARDSSAIEYSGDLFLQLVREDPEEHPDDVKLCVVKSRFTRTNFKGYDYTLLGDVSYMEEGTSFKPTTKTPTWFDGSD